MILPPVQNSGQGSNPGLAASATFGQKLARSWEAGLFLCVGLDGSYSRLPVELAHLPPEDALFEFNRQIITATFEYAAAYKPNIAFYEQSGPPGLQALKRTCDWLRATHPLIPILLDAKRGDLASTNQAYAAAFFDYYAVDALTVHAYLGGEALAPFLNRADKGIFVLCRTSNPESAEIQLLELNDRQPAEPLYLRVARLASGPQWNRQGNVGLVAGATYPQELALIRQAAPDLPLLIPGIGAQGGELQAVLSNGLDRHGAGVLINASRSIIYASSGEDFARAARQAAARLADEIQQGRQQVLAERQGK